MKTPQKASITASIVLAGALALTGCSGSAAPADTSSSTQEQPATNSAELTKENFAERISSAQLEAGSAHVSMTMPDGGGSTTEGSIQISDDPSKISGSITMQMPTGAAEVRIVNGTMYMNMGDLSQNKFIDLSQTAFSDQISASVSQLNPEEQLNTFTDAIESFTAEPFTEQIDGVDVTKVTLSLNTEKLLASNAALGAQAESMTEGLGETLDYIMYIGADDLPRRITTPSLMGETGLDMDYSAWGEPVSVEAPTADQLIDPSVLGM